MDDNYYSDSEWNKRKRDLYWQKDEKRNAKVERWREGGLTNDGENYFSYMRPKGPGKYDINKLNELWNVIIFINYKIFFVYH